MQRAKALINKPVFRVGAVKCLARGARDIRHDASESLLAAESRGGLIRWTGNDDPFVKVDPVPVHHLGEVVRIIDANGYSSERVNSCHDAAGDSKF